MLKFMPDIFRSPCRSATSCDSLAKSALSRFSSARSRQVVIFWPWLSYTGKLWRLPRLTVTPSTLLALVRALLRALVISLASLAGSVFCDSLKRVTFIRSWATSWLTSARRET
ncbi:hypothetical protein D3C80_1747940 [compost metagenome]